MGRDGLLRQLDDQFQEFFGAIDGLSDEQMTKVWYGDWGVRDILAHIVGWHREMTGVFERISPGREARAGGSGL